mmetsp:Transcript_19123/g.35747  ORF Transcript_19123/g.35747 Transcript_19123/m.35747 type:complete len:200 (-) Transcript_19123:162-761(-)
MTSKTASDTERQTLLPLSGSSHPSYDQDSSATDDVSAVQRSFGFRETKTDSSSLAVTAVTTATTAIRHQRSDSEASVTALKRRLQLRKEASWGLGESGEDPNMGQRSNFVSIGNCAGPIVAILAIPILWVIFTGFVVVSPGELAVIVTLGHVDVYEPGPHFRTPFVSTVHTMSTKTQLFSESNNIPTKEGLTVGLDVAL